MSLLKRAGRTAFAGALLLLAACTSTPQASRERDSLAKEFLTHPNAATLYVYRSPFNWEDTDTVLFLNGRLIGTAVPGGYFRIDTAPGYNMLHGTGIDLGEFRIDARPGQVYVIALEVFGGHAFYQLVPEAQGRERVRACCALMENWAPGQRPLIR